MRSESPAVVKVVQQDDVGETIKIFQTGTVLLKHLHGALYAGPACRLNWHALRFCERRVDHANCLEFNLHLLSRERTGITSAAQIYGSTASASGVW